MRERDKPAYPQANNTRDTGLTKYELTVIEMAAGFASTSKGEPSAPGTRNMGKMASFLATAIWDALEAEE